MSSNQTSGSFQQIHIDEYRVNHYTAIWDFLTA